MEAEIFNGFVLGEVLGRGAFGVVRRAKNVQTEEEFAVKIQDVGKLRKKFMLHGKNFTNELQREIAILKKINHPYILGLREAVFDETENKMYFFMELITNGRLRPASEETLCRQAFQILEALHYLHNCAKIVHGDIKPENVLLDESGDIKIIDFGCSKLIDQDEKATLFNGTKAYQPPELELRVPVMATKVDVWAVGVTFYKLITSRLPAADASELPPSLDPLMRDFIF